jgi:HEAT repeat protein
MRDVLVAIPEAQDLARHPSPDVRAAALRYAAATGLVQGQRLLVPALSDEDVRVAALAVSLLADSGWQLPGVFDGLTRLIRRLPATGISADGLDAAARLVNARGQQALGVLLPWLPRMDANGRLRVAREIGAEQILTANLRQVLVNLLSDRSAHVRASAIATLTKTKLPPSQAPAV